jgi:NAD(P)-dependent dehydrogenase (short-subunit alcohol dehydrogenase family)
MQTMRAEGAKVVVVDAISKESEKTVETIKPTGGTAVFVHADVDKAVDAEKSRRRNSSVS